jgi:uncharacterized protein YndB with AHSA1/START domain/DNA-binding transcriptional ArsR family regulator
MQDEAVFKALADPTRRKLLDRLFKRDGQTLGELCERLDMTRFGAMKHLRLLEDAHLVVTRKVGREKLHYLNPVPIRRIHDRWIGKFREPLTKALVALKDELEGVTVMASPKHVYEVFIRTTPEKLWDAITNPEMTKRYFYGSRVKSSLEKRAPIRYVDDDDKDMIHGEVVEVVPHKRLVTTFITSWDPSMKDDPPSRVTWEIEKRGETCKLTLTHDGFDTETKTYKSVGPGWNPVLSGLKTLLETGKPLEIAPAEA